MKTKTKYIPLPDDIHVGSHTHVPPETIIMIQAEINYSLIFLANGSKVIVSTCLKNLENRFAIIQSFARVHKSYLVNLDYFKSYNEEQQQLIDQLTKNMNSMDSEMASLKKLFDVKNDKTAANTK